MTIVTLKKQHVLCNNLRLSYLDWGTEGKPPLVCLHGHGGDAHIWDEFAEAMAPSYHVYALDQRGHGDSQWAADGYDRDRFVDDLGRFLDVLGVWKATLVGASMGGWNSLLYAAVHPGRVERVILVDIAPEMGAPSGPPSPPRPPRPLDFGSVEEAVAWTRQGNPWPTDQRLRRDVEAKTRRREDGRWVWKADPRLSNASFSADASPEGVARYWRSLEAIPCPVLEVRGKESPTVSDQVLQRMAKANPRFTSVDVARAGHVVCVDKPQEFIAATRAFLGVPG